MNTKALTALFACVASLAVAPAVAQENPLARFGFQDPATILQGAWNGADLENRSNCTAPQNNGSHGTYAEYDISFDTTRSFMGIDETAITGLHCTYSGTYTYNNFQPAWSGNYGCSDGKTGSFQSQAILSTPNAISLRLSIKLNGTESCTVDAILGGSRF